MRRNRPHRPRPDPGPPGDDNPQRSDEPVPYIDPDQTDDGDETDCDREAIPEWTHVDSQNLNQTRIRPNTPLIVNGAPVVIPREVAGLWSDGKINATEMMILVAIDRLASTPGCGAGTRMCHATDLDLFDALGKRVLLGRVQMGMDRLISMGYVHCHEATGFRQVGIAEKVLAAYLGR